MSRSRLYVLVDAFERDIRNILSKYVIADVGEQEGLGSFYESCATKRSADSTGASPSLAHYLGLREGYDLLNSHRQRLPLELATEIRDLTINLDRLVAIRNRVMHARPLAVGDSDAALSLLSMYNSTYWMELRRTIAHLQADPAWEPVAASVLNEGSRLHNLPLPDYDDTGLIGRSREVEEIQKLLRRGREPVITITGEGGIGKTALAVQVAYGVVDDPEANFDAVLWTSLKFEKLTAFGVRDISGAVRDLVGAIQPAAQAIDHEFRGAVSDLAELLEGLNVLLIIDNLETVSGEEFKEFYENLPDSVQYLITSRVGVGEYERRYPLSPLSDRDSLQLFNQFVRARRIEGLQKLSNPTRVRVVAELRYSPLAIKWFALAVEAGNDPLSLIRHQDELLEFCVRSVYDGLSPSAQEALVALAVLGRSLSADEIVVLLDRSLDDVSTGLQELMRGSLVRREAGSVEELALQITLTDTATQFLSRRVQPDLALQRQLEMKDREFREVSERRMADLAARSLAPIVVRERTPSDAPTCTVLRQALLAARRDPDSPLIYERLDLARRMNPDFWEVDRVEGFIRDAAGDLTAATACYERAYQTATGEDRGVVAHFFAGHLARKVRDLKRAIEFADEAHALLNQSDTAVALGSYLAWSHQFERAMPILESAVPGSSGKGRVIAISALAEGWRRFGEAAGEEGRNFLQQSERAWKGYEIALVAIESGIADERLRATAADCALTAVRAANVCAQANTKVPALAERLDSIERSLVRFVATKHWTALCFEIYRLARHRGAPASARRLAHSAAKLEGPIQGARASAPSSEPEKGTFVGEIVNVSSKYGFIRHPSFPENLFFHAGAVLDEAGISGLRAGNLVQFRPEEDARGTRATNVFCPG